MVVEGTKYTVRSKSCQSQILLDGPHCLVIPKLELKNKTTYYLWCFYTLFSPALHPTKQVNLKITDVLLCVLKKTLSY